MLFKQSCGSERIRWSTLRDAYFTIESPSKTYRDGIGKFQLSVPLWEGKSSPKKLSASITCGGVCKVNPNAVAIALLGSCKTGKLNFSSSAIASLNSCRCGQSATTAAPRRSNSLEIFCKASSSATQYGHQFPRNQVSTRKFSPESEDKATDSVRYNNRTSVGAIAPTFIACSVTLLATRLSMWSFRTSMISRGVSPCSNSCRIFSKR